MKDPIDVKGLQDDLGRAIDGEVAFDALSRALYASDSSNFRQPPLGIVRPLTVDDIVAAHRVCREYGAPITPRGTGTSLAGQAVNRAVIIDASRHLTAIGTVDPDACTVSVEPGAINGQVTTAARAHGLIFGPDPATHAYCTIGGNLGTNACGSHSVQAAFYGPGSRTSDNVESLEVLTYDGLRLTVGATPHAEFEAIVAEGGRRGAVYQAMADLAARYPSQIKERYPDIPRRVSGYNLNELLPERGFNVARALVGTEGTCVTILRATLKLTPALAKRALVAVAYDSVADAGDAGPAILALRPVALEGFDSRVVRDDQQILPGPGNGWLLVEFGADEQADADDQARALVDQLTGDGVDAGRVKRFDAKEAGAAWKVRESALGTAAFDPNGTDYWAGWEDSAVPPDRLGDYLRDLHTLYDRHGLSGAIYGHFGQGCVHSRISFDLRTRPGVRVYRAFMEDAADLVVGYGGSLSGEHGDGQQRAELLPKMFGDELVDAFRQFKAIWDPEGRMNPGKVVDPYRLDEHLRLATPRPARPDVEFAYPADGGDFRHASVRCVGVGHCRNPDPPGVMCPSFGVTGEEEHTTRGRAHLLFEMLQGDIITTGWRSPEVKDALDLCLACKGCTNDCPVSVDMPTYKAEFLHHHFKGRLRPRHAYAMGLIDLWAAGGSRAPGVANWIGKTPLPALGAGVARQRSMPALARVTLRRWFAERPAVNDGAPRVLLWADTFSNFFDTEVGKAGVEALEAAGYQVVLPGKRLCCGRPLYDYGFLGLARRYLRRCVDSLRDELRAGTAVVGLEPSCLAVFKDELPGLLPGDADGARLTAQSFHFAEFLAGRDHPRPLPELGGKALVWGHCHHRATGGLGPEERVLRAAGVDVAMAPPGCCGLAGSWGFEAGHYDLSMQIAEQGLLPAVRGADPDALIVADGFSCRTQLRQSGTGREPLHLAQVLARARQQS